MTRFTVNGNPVQYQLPADTPLLWALRDASNLTGTKYGCGVGLCGACTVHIDGVATRSCQVTIGDIEGTFVTTIEGLSDDRSHPVQQAWIAEQVPQCGYCQSGMIMAAAKAWYRDLLGMEWDYGLLLRHADDTADGYSLVTPFEAATDYFAPSEQPFMINLRVDDLDGMLAALAAKGVAPLGRQDEEYGAFAWLLDPDGIKIELWQQKGPAPSPAN
jgi:aerobic-type carbon monoxide dehydrogenase small subunit (CoxS/CutS family)